MIEILKSERLYLCFIQQSMNSIDYAWLMGKAQWHIVYELCEKSPQSKALSRTLQGWLRGSPSETGAQHLDLFEKFSSQITVSHVHKYSFFSLFIDF